SVDLKKNLLNALNLFSKFIFTKTSSEGEGFLSSFQITGIPFEMTLCVRVIFSKSIIMSSRKGFFPACQQAGTPS
ncbi:MAG: hypothetical protein WCX88_01985, partial [Patescibacteria group bacterium]